MAEKRPGRRGASVALATAASLEGVVASWRGSRAAERQTLGLAFEIEDLRRAGVWAERRGLSLGIRLDHAVNGTRLEELLCLTGKGQSPPQATIWRSGNGVVLQRSGELPRSHRTLAEALAQLGCDERRWRLAFWRR